MNSWKNTNKSNLVGVAILLATALTSCKQAGYQVLQPGSDSPQNFQGGGPAAPTARIEAMDNGVSVTWTYVGNKVDIRPTLDTLDPNYVGVVQCDNPGIIQASYDLGNGQKPVVDRNGCTSLAAAGQVFTQAGEYVVQMQVKSQDNEVAWASMTLRVLDRGITRAQVEGGFTIHAKPILTAVNQPVTFTGICELNGQLTMSWDFADGAKADGAALQHTYLQNGQYRVTALCKSNSGRTMQASLTVVVMTNPPAVPDVAIPVPANNPNLPPAIITPQPCDQNQGPCSSKVPTQQNTKVITYGSDCTCYSNYYYRY